MRDKLTARQVDTIKHALTLDEARRIASNIAKLPDLTSCHRRRAKLDSCIRFIQNRASRPLSLPGGRPRPENGTPMLQV